MKKNLILVIASISISLFAIAQHEHHQHQAPKKDTVPVNKTHQQHSQPLQKKDTVPAKSHQTGHDHSAHHAETPSTGEHMMHDNMSHAFSRNLPMTRNGSGTAWLPDNSPMFGYMYHSKKWMYMIHGDVFVRYNNQDLFDKGSRGDSKFDAPNMVMFMGQRNVGRKGLFHFSSMFSLDPVTVGLDGYPLLFQTGETYKGNPLVDRQHPHDLFSELSVSYAHAFSKKADAFIYLGYPGEPAIGPSAYVHRPSGFFNPDAPLSHHWVDATHITFGVATLGVRYGNWKLEGSLFNGTEPDEERYGFDKLQLNSASGRISFNPSPSWAMQVSRAYVKEPEALHPGEDVHRTTASVTYSRRSQKESFTNITALWGQNKSGHHTPENAFLLEGSQIKNRFVFYSRYEWVQKSREELDLDELIFGHDALFPVHALTGGLSYDIIRAGKTRVALGGQLSVYRPAEQLESLYGKLPLAGQIYLRLYPARMQ